jgi:hypothetical protein
LSSTNPAIKAQWAENSTANVPEPFNANAILDFVSMAVPVIYEAYSTDKPQFLEHYFTKAAIRILSGAKLSEIGPLPSSLLLEPVGLEPSHDGTEPCVFRVRVHTESSYPGENPTIFLDLAANINEIVTSKKCPICGAPTTMGDIKCKFCGADVRTSAEFPIIITRIQIY